jgi:hypothetical protein
MARKEITARYGGSCRACSAPIAVGDSIYHMRPYGWVCARCAGDRDSGAPTPADVLNKVTRDMVVKPSLSLTNSQAEVLLRTVLALAPDVVPVRRPHRDLPPGGRWFNGMTGWAPTDPMAYWQPEVIVGYMMDALEDGRSTNLNKGAVFQLLSFLEDQTGWPFFFENRPLEHAHHRGSTHADQRALVEFRDDCAPLDSVEAPKETPGDPAAPDHRDNRDAVIC